MNRIPPTAAPITTPIETLLDPELAGLKVVKLEFKYAAKEHIQYTTQKFLNIVWLGIYPEMWKMRWFGAPRA
jgi:hypothetical protein